MNVIGLLPGVPVSSLVPTVAVMYTAPFSSYRRFDVSISFISSRVGTSTVSSASTAFSSSTVGSKRSAQRNCSGNGAGGACSIHL